MSTNNDIEVNLDTGEIRRLREEKPAPKFWDRDFIFTLIAVAVGYAFGRSNAIMLKSTTFWDWIALLFLGALLLGGIAGRGLGWYMYRKKK